MDSLVCGFGDFWGPSNEESSVTKDNLGRFYFQFFISSAFQLEIFGQDGSVIDALGGRLALYKESLQIDLRLPLPPFISKILDFYRILPI